MPSELDITLSFQTIGIYSVKHSILRAMKENLESFKGVLLDVGCGNQPYKPLFKASPSITQYIGLDIQYPFAKTVPDLYWDGTRIPLEDASVDTVILTEVLEHCPFPETVLSEIYRVLRPNGRLFITVPFLWMLHEVPHDEYRYTPFSLKRHLMNAGFPQVEIKKLGGWNASLAQMLGLWVAYKKHPKILRMILKICCLPLIYCLLRTDRRDLEFKDETMITGLYSLVLK